MDIKPQIGIRTDPATPETASYLIRLGECLNLPVADPSGPEFSYVLAFHGSRLELRKEADPKTAPLSADFLSGAVFYRFLHDRRINQPLAKAVGIKSGYRPTVLDGTAGFGEDAFVLASLGCRVTMIERSKVIWALLTNAISRCGENDRVKRVFDQRVTLKLADTIDYLHSSEISYDTVFLDPMYPSLSKSTLNKQRMRILRDVVGDDADGSVLLTAALKRAAKRVAVKRPVRACSLDDREPSFAIKAKSSRYDIYLIPSPSY